MIAHSLTGTVFCQRETCGLPLPVLVAGSSKGPAVAVTVVRCVRCRTWWTVGFRWAPMESGRVGREVVGVVASEAPGIPGLRRTLPHLTNFTLAERLAILQDFVEDGREDAEAVVDPVEAFLVECCVLNTSVSTPIGALHQTYRAWCREHGLTPIPLKLFGKALRERGVESFKSTARRWRGVALRGGFVGKMAPEKSPEIARVAR
jgi:hypothetical protein